MRTSSSTYGLWGLVLSVTLLLGACNGNGQAAVEGSQHSEEHAFRVQIVADGLEHPWALAFLPGGRQALVTERPGRLQRIDLDSGDSVSIEGVPEVAAVGQGGLLDVVLHPQFAENGWVYLSYAAAGEGGYATHVGRGRLSGGQLQDFEVLHVATPFVGGGRHFGSRLLFDRDGYLYITTGDRGERDLAQQLDAHQGATLRLTADGRIPDDNPFVGQEDAEPAIYSYGHRNSQGMALHPQSGRVWQHEHGPSGGDELNVPEPGKNYGWPLTSYGVEYGSGRPIGPDPDELEGTVAPIYHWEESFAPSGMAFYEGGAFPRWQGDLFIGALAKQQLARLSLDGERVVAEETLLEDQGWRIRDVRVGPQGHLYLLVDAESAPLVRLVPAESP